jgi:hypothetical protein
MISHANGGDGWSKWEVDIYGYHYSLKVTSRAEFRDGTGVTILERKEIRSAQEAIAVGESYSNAYAHRMAS